MADRCLQRPDCTFVTIRRKKGFTTTTKNPSPLHLHCKGHVVKAPLFAEAKTLGSPVSLFGPYPIQMAWVYLTRGLCLVGPVWPPYAVYPIDFYPPQCRLVPWLALFQSHGIPQRSVFEQAALELPATRRRSCQSCYFRELGEERENVYRVCEGERFRVSCPHHCTLEDSSPVTASNIMSSQSYKHVVKKNCLEVYWLRSVWLIKSVLWVPGLP